MAVNQYAASAFLWHDQIIMTTPAAHSCDHCDSSIPHSHDDPFIATHNYLAKAKRLAIIRLVLIVVAVIALPVISALTDTSTLAFVFGVLGWFIVMAAGLLSLNAQPKPGAKAFLISAIVAAAVTPLVALGIGVLRPGTSEASPIITAATAGIGWLLAGLAVDLIRMRQLEALVKSDSRDGEAARDALGRLDDTQTAELGWSIFTPVLVGCYIWLIIALPLIVIVLVPLHVVISIVSRRASFQKG